MKRNLLFALMALFIFSCAKDEFPNADYSGDDISIETRGAKVDVCHNGHVIRVSINAVHAHQAHGDAVDMDGDGYFDKANECGPTDCDDNNAKLTDNCKICSDCDEKLNQTLNELDPSVCYTKKNKAITLSYNGSTIFKLDSSRRGGYTYREDTNGDGKVNNRDNNRYISKECYDCAFNYILTFKSCQ